MWLLILSLMRVILLNTRSLRIPFLYRIVLSVQSIIDSSLSIYNHFVIRVNFLKRKRLSNWIIIFRRCITRLFKSIHLLIVLLMILLISINKLRFDRLELLFILLTLWSIRTLILDRVVRYRSLHSIFFLVFLSHSTNLYINSSVILYTKLMILLTSSKDKHKYWGTLNKCLLENKEIINKRIFITFWRLVLTLNSRRLMDVRIGRFFLNLNMLIFLI